MFFVCFLLFCLWFFCVQEMPTTYCNRNLTLHVFVVFFCAGNSQSSLASSHADHQQFVPVGGQRVQAVSPSGHRTHQVSHDDNVMWQRMTFKWWYDRIGYPFHSISCLQCLFALALSMLVVSCFLKYVTPLSHNDEMLS